MSVETREVSGIGAHRRSRRPGVATALLVVAAGAATLTGASAAGASASGASAAGASAAGASASEMLPSLTRLELVVTLDYHQERLDGTATLTVRNDADAPIDRVPLLLNRLLRVQAVRDGAGRELVHHQRLTAFEEFPRMQIDAVEVELAEPLGPGRSARLAVDYGGWLVGYTETGMRYVRDRIDRDFTILRADALAFPTVGGISLAVNRASPPDLFDFEVAVTVPAGMVVANGGEPLGREERDGGVTWRYRSRSPAPYLIVAVAPYGVLEDDGLRVFHFAEDEAGARRILDASRRAAARLAEIFGPLERPLALTIMEIPVGWGSQASLQGGLIQEAGAFRDAAQIERLYHELSHLWNADDLDAPSPRWNEGLASFLQGRLARELDGWTGETAELERTATSLLERCADAPCARVPLRRYGQERLTDLSYPVGRLMFAALYRSLGESAFDRALRRHFQDHQAVGTRTDDLVAAFVAEGDPAASRIFDDWLESTAWLARLRAAASAQALLESYRVPAE